MRAHRLFLIVAASVIAAATPDACGAQQAAVDRPAAELANPLAAYSLEGLPETRERPLFAPTRRPRPLPAAVVDAAAPPPPPPPPPPDVALLGIVIDGEEARAVIRAGAGDKTMRARIGDEINGWKVTQIEGRQIVLSLGDRSATFTMFNRDAATRGTSSGALITGEPPQASRREGTQPNRSDADSLGKPATGGRKQRRGRS